MAGGDSAAKDDWVKRVLGVSFAAAPRGAVNYAKLLLEWRSAQRRAVDSLVAFGASFLDLDEVRDDGRFATVARAVEALPKLLPEFGETLADHLDAAMSARAAEASANHLRGAMTAVAAYRQQLATVPALAALAGFAKRAVGLDVDVLAVLDEALTRIEQEISTRVSLATP